jgi:hypothetical protein
MLHIKAEKWITLIFKKNAIFSPKIVIITLIVGLQFFLICASAFISVSQHTNNEF